MSFELQVEVFNENNWMETDVRLMGPGELGDWQTQYLNLNICSVLHEADWALCKVAGSIIQI